MPISAAEF